jgi:hypothetical protein
MFHTFHKDCNVSAFEILKIRNMGMHCMPIFSESLGYRGPEAQIHSVKTNTCIHWAGDLVIEESNDTSWSEASGCGGGGSGAGCGRDGNAAMQDDSK